MVQLSVREMVAPTVYVSVTRSGGVKLDFFGAGKRRSARLSRAHIKRAGGVKQALAAWSAQETANGDAPVVVFA